MGCEVPLGGSSKFVEQRPRKTPNPCARPMVSSRAMEPTQALNEAIDVLRRGGVVAFPTETVYGLGAHAALGAAVERVFEIKGRPRNRALIIHVDGTEAIDTFAVDVPDYARQIAEHFWPGPVTIVCKRHASVVDEVTGGGDTVAIRMPDHPLALGLIRGLGQRLGTRAGVAAPSANRFGEPPATSATEVIERLGAAGTPNGPDFILDGGQCPSRVPSTIVHCVEAGPRLLRQGATPVEAIEAVIGRWVDR